MKTTFALLGSILLLSTGAAFAQSAGNGVSANATTTSANQKTGHDITGFSSKWSGPGLTQKQIYTPPNPNVVLKPRAAGATVAIYHYGPVMLSPVAPASYGIGERYLAAPDSRYDLDHESGPAAHRDTGGIKLFSLEF
jgi:hypothetical protein